MARREEPSPALNMDHAPQQINHHILAGLRKLARPGRDTGIVMTVERNEAVILPLFWAASNATGIEKANGNVRIVVHSKTKSAWQRLSDVYKNSACVHGNSTLLLVLSSLLI